MKKRMLISFSGGRTSGFMLKWLLDNKQDEYEMKVVFSNTGKEHEATLDFVKNCQDNFGVEVVWIEAQHKNEAGNKFSEKGWSVKHKIVDYETASRNGEPFEEMISVLGIPCSSAPFCSDQLKRKAIESYMKSIGWKDYYTAIGIRVDEIDRVSASYRKRNLVYPLISMRPTTNTEVLNWWAGQSFDLEVPSTQGNCDNCWKKGFKTLAYNAKHYPETFDWWDQMVKKYKDVRSVNNTSEISFYRGGKSVEDLFAISNLNQLELDLMTKDEKLDGCSESCEPF